MDSIYRGFKRSARTGRVIGCLMLATAAVAGVGVIVEDWPSIWPFQFMAALCMSLTGFYYGRLSAWQTGRHQANVKRWGEVEEIMRELDRQ